MADAPAVTRVAAVLFDGFTALDVYGPVQAFGACHPQPDGAPLRSFMEYVWRESAEDDPFA